MKTNCVGSDAASSFFFWGGLCACACAQIKGNIKSLSFSALQKTHKVTADEVKGRFGGGCQGSGCESATLMMLMCYYSFHVLNPL